MKSWFEWQTNTPDNDGLVSVVIRFNFNECRNRNDQDKNIPLEISQEILRALQEAEDQGMLVLD